MPINHSLRRVLLTLLVGTALFVTWRTARMGWLAWQTAQAGRQLVAAAEAPPGSTDATALTAAFATRLGALSRELQPLALALQLLGAMPGPGPMLAAAPNLADAAARLAPHLEWLLGMDAPRTYLLLIQNNHELRATGGFISAFGRLLVDRGKIAGLQIVDSYDVFSLQSEYPPAPQPMIDHMGIQLQVARDANWSPDLPSAASALLPLYTQDTGITVDGILTIDMNALSHLVAALPGLRVAASDKELTPENLENTLIRLWDQPAGAAGASAANQPGDEAGEWWSQRKNFMTEIGDAILQRLEAGSDPAELAALAKAVVDAFDDRSLQLWVEDPAAQATLAELGWDGSLRPPASGDFLAVVDSNLGYNKVNAVVERSLAYGVDWHDGAGEATLTLTYTHPITTELSVCDPAPRYGDSYGDLFERCYFDYIRVYAPAGSQLSQIEGVTPGSATSETAEHGLQQFGGFLVLPPNRTHTVTFVYQLPPQITAKGYRLRIQRQSGTLPLPATVTVNGVTTSDRIARNTWDWPPPAGAAR